TANIARLALAAFLLGLWAHGFGGGLGGAGLPWFFLSGIVGFALGDTALFGALQPIGPRLTILLTQCLAAPIATSVEWAWLGTKLKPIELIFSTVISPGAALRPAP